MPVIVGSAAAYKMGTFNFFPALIALVCSVLIQTATNYVNDLYDFLSGKDTKERLGPERALASGLLSVNEMKVGILITFFICFSLGLYLVYLAGWIVLLIGILSIAAGIAYTAGPYPLAYNGLGDVFVFIFFGIIGTCGTYFVQSLSVNTFVLLSSIPVGALITNILIVNNYRDAEEDEKNNKRTLSVIFGRDFSRYQFTILLVLSYIIPIVLFFYFDQSFWIFLPFITLPAAFRLIYMLKNFSGRSLNKTLELSAKFSALYGLLFSIGIVL